MQETTKCLPSLNTVRVAVAVFEVGPARATYRALAAKTNLEVEQVRGAAYCLRDFGALEIGRVGRYALVRATSQLSAYLQKHTKISKFKYAADQRTVEKYKQDIGRGHELERTLLPHIPSMVGYPRAKASLIGSDKGGRFFSLDEAHRITSKPDVIVRVEPGGVCVEVQGIYTPYPFVDFKDYKVHRALKTRGALFLQADAVRGAYAVLTPRWIRENGRYIQHPVWSKPPAVIKLVYRVDHSRIPWRALPPELGAALAELRKKYGSATPTPCLRL
jgi:hypothetical protein